MDENKKEDLQKTFLNDHVSYFFTHIMSVDETRISVLMIAFVFALGFSAYMYMTTNELNHAWVDIVETIILCISAINVATSFTCNKNMNSSNTNDPNGSMNNYSGINYRNYNIKNMDK